MVGTVKKSIEGQAAGGMVLPGECAKSEDGGLPASGNAYIC